MRMFPSSITRLRALAASVLVLTFAIAVVGGPSAAVAAVKKLVTGADIRNGTITGVDVRNGSLSGAKITDGSIAASDVRDSSIGTLELADSAVTGSDVADGAITGADLATGSVSSAAIADGAVELADISTAARTSLTEVTAGSVGSAAIADGSVQLTDLSSTAQSAALSSGITTQTANSDSVPGNNDVQLLLTCPPSSPVVAGAGGFFYEDLNSSNTYTQADDTLDFDGVLTGLVRPSSSTVWVGGRNGSIAARDFSAWATCAPS